MNMRAISPVIATVIIVSVAIAIAVAVAFWMTGITGLFTRYEKLEVISAYATGSESAGWTVVLEVRNTGTTDVTIDEIFINGKPYNEWSEVSLTGTVTSLPEPLPTGESRTIKISIGSGSGFKSGQIVEIKVHTAAGNEYPKSVQLP